MHGYSGRRRVPVGPRKAEDFTPAPVTKYRLTAEEIIARYGPPVKTERPSPLAAFCDPVMKKPKRRGRPPKETKVCNLKDIPDQYRYTVSDIMNLSGRCRNTVASAVKILGIQAQVGPGTHGGKRLEFTRPQMVQVVQYLQGGSVTHEK